MKKPTLTLEIGKPPRFATLFSTAKVAKILGSARVCTHSLAAAQKLLLYRHYLLSVKEGRNAAAVVVVAAVAVVTPAAAAAAFFNSKFVCSTFSLGW